jgi:hypothetical protein
MSPLAKVFVVVNLILSVVFFGSSATLFVTRTNWRQKAVDFKKDAADEIVKLEAKYKEQADRLIKSNDRETKLLKDYNFVSTEKENLKGQLAAKETALAEANHRIDAEVKARTVLDDAKTTLEKQKTDLLAAVDSKTKEADDAKAEKMKAINEMSRFKLDLDKSSEELQTTLIAKKEIGDRLQTLSIQMDAIKRANPKLDPILEGAAPPINAIIEAVRPTEKLVVLSVGKNQKVQEGFRFTIYRGDRFIGKVQVTKVYEDLAGAKIIYTNENESIQIGDKAATQI